jgi:hypothetical protein
MQKPEQEIFNLSLVIIGSFDPRIFHTDWLVNKKLIRESEGDLDNLKVLHPDLTIIETQEFKLEVRPSRFEIQTLKESFREPMKDLCVSIFRLLSESPIDAFGVNYSRHFKFTVEKDYINFGYHLAPIKTLFDFIDDPRLLDISITDRKQDKIKGIPTKNIKIFPSDLIPSLGVGINVNTHFDETLNGLSFSELLSNRWESIAENSEYIMAEVWNRYK